MSAAAVIRAAEPDDVPLLLSLVGELATYERAPERVTGTEEMLHDALFGEHAVAEAVIAEVDGVPVGFALFFTTFSTWLCRRGMWLEDLYVRPEQRRGGIGRTLLGHLARIAVERGYGRMEWAALRWNTPALNFYATLRAEPQDEWETFRLEGEALDALAAEPAAAQRS